LNLSLFLFSFPFCSFFLFFLSLVSSSLVTYKRCQLSRLYSIGSFLSPFLNFSFHFLSLPFTVSFPPSLSILRFLSHALSSSSSLLFIFSLPLPHSIYFFPPSRFHHSFPSYISLSL
jgi:hypothetical protein